MPEGYFLAKETKTYLQMLGNVGILTNFALSEFDIFAKFGRHDRRCEEGTFGK